MPFYTKYKAALAKHGYTVDEWGSVWDERGNQAAAEDRFGNAYANDPNVTDICTKEESSLASKAKKVVKKVTPNKKAEE